MEEIIIGIKWGILLWVIISQIEYILLKREIEFPICKKCLVFWVTILITNIIEPINIFSAPVAAIIMWWIDKNETIEL
jgi:hypothetical protein